MARPRKPWFRKSNKRWYVEIDGKQVNLGSDRTEAHLLFHELMAQPVQKVPATPRVSLLEIVDQFLEWVQRHRSPDTYEWYRYRLQRFCRMYSDKMAMSIRPFHVEDWVNKYELSQTSIRNYKRAVKSCFRWAVKQGYLESNPVEHLEVPSAEHKEVLFSEMEFQWLLDQYADEEFRDLLITTWRTGCRPQESLRVEARHFDAKHQRWVFPPSEGKTGLRVVYLNDVSFEISQRLALKWPEGPLFRNANGIGWTTDAVNCRFYRLKKRTGKLFSLYALRHSWATHALQKGLDPLTVAILMGHKDPSMLARVYQHLSLDPAAMLENAKKAAG